MAHARNDLDTGGVGSDRPLADRIRAAEVDYLNCVADFGCDSGEAYTAQWHLRELQRLVHSRG